MRSIRTLTIYLPALSLLYSLSAHALMSISPGKYELSAYIYSDLGGAFAVFNPRTKSEFRLKLIGPKSSNLKFQGAKALHIKIRVTKKIMSSHGEAELISFRNVDKREKLTIWADNDLINLAGKESASRQ